MDIEALIPIVDANDEVVGTALRSEMRARNLLHRCAAVVVLSEDRTRLLVHQRAATKSFWPSWWDCAAGGVVEVGEELADAAARELHEELGVDAPLTKLGSGRYTDADVDVFMHVWAAFHDGPFTFTDGEVQRVEWVMADQLGAVLRDDTRQWCRDTVHVAVPLLAALGGVWKGA